MLDCRRQEKGNCTATTESARASSKGVLLSADYRTRIVRAVEICVGGRRRFEWTRKGAFTLVEFRERPAARSERPSRERVNLFHSFAALGTNCGHTHRPCSTMAGQAPGFLGAEGGRAYAYITLRKVEFARSVMRRGALIRHCVEVLERIDGRRRPPLRHSTGMGLRMGAVGASRPTSVRNAMTTPYAPANIRDQFLLAIDANQQALSIKLAANLTHCNNPLPGVTCALFGIPLGSTYSCAAREVLNNTSS